MNNFVILEGNLLECPIRENDTTVTFKLWCKHDDQELEQQIVVKGRLADVVRQYLDIGSRVLVSGTLADGIVIGKEVKLLPGKI